MPRWPARISVCTASGTSTITTRRVGAGGPSIIAGTTSRGAHPPNVRSTAANASAAAMSPTTARMQLPGAKYRSWKSTRSLRVMRSIDAGVPAAGYPYG